MNHYPNPCDICQKGNICTMRYGCEEWRIRYLYRQKQINAYSRKLMRPKTTEYRKVFAYEHPDIIRKYLEHSPCEGCKEVEVCDTPCPAYLHWWNARMEIARRRVGL